jgi:hypothetical protein
MSTCVTSSLPPQQLAIRHIIGPRFGMISLPGHRTEQQLPPRATSSDLAKKDQAAEDLGHILTERSADVKPFTAITAFEFVGRHPSTLLSPDQCLNKARQAE